MYNLKVYTSNIYVANYGDTVANHGSVFSRNNLHFRSCIFTNCMFLIARHYHWRKAVSNKREIALLKKIQLVSKRRDNFKCWVLLLLFSLVLSSSHTHTHTHICMYMYGTFSICRFLFCQRCKNSKCYTYSGGRFLCCLLEAVIFCFLVSFSAVYSTFDIQSYFKLVDNFIQQIYMGIISLFIEVCQEGIHDNIHSRSVFHSIHGCMVKETWLPVQAVHIRRHFSNISGHWIHNSCSEQLVKLFLSLFVFHFQQGSNKT